MFVEYNIPRSRTLTSPGGGPIQVCNDLQAIVDRPREGFNVELKRHVTETNGRALMWMHHGYTRDVLGAFSNRGRSTPIINDQGVTEVTLADYEEHLSRVEKYAFNWTGTVFCFVALQGPKFDQVQQHLRFLSRWAELRTRRHPLYIVVVPTFTSNALPYLDCGREFRYFLGRYRNVFRYNAEASGWCPENIKGYEQRVWRKFRLYLAALGVDPEQIMHIGERYSDNRVRRSLLRKRKVRQIVQERNRCVGRAAAKLGGQILQKYCFPGPLR